MSETRFLSSGSPLRLSTFGPTTNTEATRNQLVVVGNICLNGSCADRLCIFTFVFVEEIGKVINAGSVFPVLSSKTRVPYQAQTRRLPQAGSRFPQSRHDSDVAPRPSRCAPQVRCLLL